MTVRLALRPSRPRHPDAAIDQRIRELDAERDPLSLPEEIVSEATKSGQRVGIPTPEPQQTPLSISMLQAMTREELNQFARTEGLESPESQARQELIFALLKQRMKANGLMYGEGTLEILPDGFGFLRSAEYHYLSCPMTSMYRPARSVALVCKRAVTWPSDSTT